MNYNAQSIHQKFSLNLLSVAVMYDKMVSLLRMKFPEDEDILIFQARGLNNLLNVLNDPGIQSFMPSDAGTVQCLLTLMCDAEHLNHLVSKIPLPNVTLDVAKLFAIEPNEHHVE